MHEGDSSDEEAEALALARLAFGTKYEKTTADKNQPVKKLVWTLVDHKELPKACARSKVEGWQGEEYNARLMNETTPVNDIYTAWKHLIPPMWLPKLVETANNSLSDDNIDKNYRLTCKAEMECILGEQLGAAVEGLGDFSSCFAVTNSPDTLFPPPGFGQYGVTKNRALIVSRAAHLSHGPLLTTRWCGSALVHGRPHQRVQRALREELSGIMVGHHGRDGPSLARAGRRG